MVTFYSTYRIFGVPIRLSKFTQKLFLLTHMPLSYIFYLWYSGITVEFALVLRVYGAVSERERVLFHQRPVRILHMIPTNLKKYLSKHPRVTNNCALVNCTPYYQIFAVKSNSRFRITVSCTVHKIWQWKHSMMVWANGIAWLWSCECTTIQ